MRTTKGAAYCLAVGFLLGVAVGVFGYRAYRIDRERSGQPPSVAPSETDIAKADAFQRAAAGGSADVVMIGDSLIDYWSDYPDLWDSASSGLKVLNFGVAGDTTYNAQWRIEHGLLGNLRPRVIVFLVGTNDLWTSSGPNVARRILSIASDVRPACDRVVIVGLLPRREAAITQKIDDCNRELAIHCDGVALQYLDVHSLMRGPDGGMRPELTTDGIHLTGEGYRIFGEALAPLLLKRPLAPSPTL